MRQTNENVSPLTLKLAFRVRNRRRKDFTFDPQLVRWSIIDTGKYSQSNTEKSLMKNV